MLVGDDKVKIIMFVENCSKLYFVFIKCYELTAKNHCQKWPGGAQHKLSKIYYQLLIDFFKKDTYVFCNFFVYDQCKYNHNLIRAKLNTMLNYRRSWLVPSN